jgi:hypothetical protein
MPKLQIKIYKKNDESFVGVQGAVFQKSPLAAGGIEINMVKKDINEIAAVLFLTVPFLPAVFVCYDLCAGQIFYLSI